MPAPDHPTPSTLYLTGSLAPAALRRRLAAERGAAVALEYDTLLDPARHPQISHWLSTRHVFGQDAAMEILETMTAVMQPYLRQRPDLGDQPGDACLRRAALGGEYQDRVSMRAFNTRLRDHLWARFDIDRLVVTAGSGVNFAFWRAVAEEKGVSAEFLHPEWQPRSLRRRLERWLCKMRKKPQPAPPAPAPGAATAGHDTRSLVLCASARVARLIQQEGVPADFHLRPVTAAGLGAPCPQVLAAETERYAAWWRRWQAQVLEAACAPGSTPCLAEYRDIFLEMGAHYSSRVYPRWSALRRLAVESMRAERPALVLCDTQIGAEDLVWCLAAAELGIPVAAYTYDFLLKPGLMFQPDFALVDGVRGIPRIVKGGYPEERIVDVRCHRRPTAPPRTAAQVEAAFTRRRPRVLYADTMTIITDPQACLHHYQTVVGAARLMPEADFLIKFHPLRSPKTEARSFIGMDESEVQSKTRFIRSLRPPANVHLCPPERGMEDCMESAAVLLNTISVSGHEAFHLGLPVIFLMRHDPSFFLFPRMEEMMEPLCAESPAALAEHLRRLFASPECRQARVAAQHRYQEEYFWKSTLTLTSAVNGLLRTARETPPLPR